jgi:membrane-associated phospholipid phosphatase
VAIHDAMAVAWDAKYTYNRPRPADLGPAFSPAIPTPRSPAYPSEHAVAAGAAAAILAYLFPNDASTFAAKAEEASQSRLLAGVDYPSDVQAGLELGRSVAARVVERAKSDGTQLKWDGQMPSGPGYWTGTTPAGPTVGQWKTWALESGDGLRPAAPPAHDSAEKQEELAELRSVERTPKMTADAYFWEYGAGGQHSYWYYNSLLARKLLEYGLASEPLAAARAFALQSISFYDATVACWDGKYAYWAARPFQLDPAYKSMFPAPNHPSYPAGHGCVSGASGAMLAYLFPLEAETFTSLANQAAESRVWAGIHFRSDVEAGLALGRAVVATVIERAKVSAR